MIVKCQINCGMINDEVIIIIILNKINKLVKRKTEYDLNFN